MKKAETAPFYMYTHIAYLKVSLFDPGANYRGSRQAGAAAYNARFL